ncbi:MAG TPA: hypothetical protein QF889_03845 [Flavobacteriaceae bacterium]|nr:hypothetical protein [Flavobacteriaceae bacterium]
MSLILGSAFIVYINSATTTVSNLDISGDEESVPATTTTTTSTTTTVPATTTTTTSTTTTAPATTTTTTSTTTTVPATTTTTTVPNLDISGDEESVQIVEENEDTPEAYEGDFVNFSGFEGANQQKLDELVLQMPQLLQNVLSNNVIFVNGCHSYAESLVGRCPYGVWDSSGTKSDGTKGADWAMSIWVSNRAFDAEKAEDVLTHESSHALSYLTRNCNTSENKSYRLDAWNYFGGEEKFADALVLYFGGSYNHYRDTGQLNDDEISYLKDYLEACTN